jgi:hypothetical protein
MDEEGEASQVRGRNRQRKNGEIEKASYRLCVKDKKREKRAGEREERRGVWRCDLTIFELLSSPRYLSIHNCYNRITL